jgi:hypothetical protein
MRSRCYNLCLIGIAFVAFGGIRPPKLAAAVLQVGPGRAFAGIAQAVRAAHPGDIIKVWPQAGNRPYRRVAILMKKPRITIEGAIPGRYIKIDGTGFDYSGRMPTPRAILQFDPTASGCVLKRFALTGAHNRDGNGAGVRINGANHVTIRSCQIYGNDMGIMSNGSYARHTGAYQLIENCRITRNGTHVNAGYNHNLYLGGTSVLVRGCDISDSITGHNLKSRAHITWVEYCYVHGSANREMDFVDSRGITDQPHSDAVVLGCVIVKKRNMSGNREVINFGRDGKANHTGTLYLVHDTIVTPYYTGAVVLSAPGAHLMMIDNQFINSSHKALLLAFMFGALAKNVRGAGNLLSAAYQPAARRFNGPMIRWKDISLPWHRMDMRPQPLMRYAGLGKLRRFAHPQPGAGGPIP